MCIRDRFSGAPVESGVSSVSRQALMDALDDTFIFTDFMKEHGIPYTDRDGVYAVSSMQQLAEWKPVLSRGVLYDLAAAGVSIWDYDNTYVEPTVFVGAGAELLPGTCLLYTSSCAPFCSAASPRAQSQPRRTARRRSAAGWISA